MVRLQFQLGHSLDAKHHSRLLPRFVQNHVEEIWKAKFSFRYISSEYNPVDIVRKGISQRNLGNMSHLVKEKLIHLGTLGIQFQRRD